jgi:hypothetical protein
MMLEIPLDKYEGYNLVLSGNYKDVSVLASSCLLGQNVSSDATPVVIWVFHDYSTCAEYSK